MAESHNTLLPAYFRWAFWSLVYLCRRRPKSLDQWLIRTTRCRKPWWKFKPSIFHNAHGKMWQVFFKDEHCCFERANLQVEVGRTESGEIVAMNIWDEMLAATPAAPDGQGEKG